MRDRKMIKSRKIVRNMAARLQSGFVSWGRSCYKQGMTKLKLFGALALLIAACGKDGGGYRTEAECNATPIKYGETEACANYPGYGWARVPFATSIRQN